MADKRAEKEKGRVVLDVAYEERDQAKAAGARWDPEKQVWYVAAGGDLGKVEQWVASPERVAELEVAGEKRRAEKAGRLMLDVPYAERDRAKAAGARWDGATWYLPAGASAAGVGEWIPTRERLAELTQAATDKRALAKPCPALNERGVRPETHNAEAFRGAWKPAGREVRWAQPADTGELWVSARPEVLRRVMVVERPLDAMSYHQLDPREDTIYVALRPGVTELAADARGYLRHLVEGERLAVVAGFSNTASGAALKRQLRDVVEAVGLAVEARAPTHGNTWNDTLQLRERDYIREIAARVVARGLELER